MKANKLKSALLTLFLCTVAIIPVSFAQKPAQLDGFVWKNKYEAEGVKAPAFSLPGKNAEVNEKMAKLIATGLLSAGIQLNVEAFTFHDPQTDPEKEVFKYASSIIIPSWDLEVEKRSAITFADGTVFYEGFALCPDSLRMNGGVATLFWTQTELFDNKSKEWVRQGTKFFYNLENHFLLSAREEKKALEFFPWREQKQLAAPKPGNKIDWNLQMPIDTDEYLFSEHAVLFSNVRSGHLQLADAYLAAVAGATMNMSLKLDAKIKYLQKQFGQEVNASNSSAGETNFDEAFSSAVRIETAQNLERFSVNSIEIKMDGDVGFVKVIGASPVNRISKDVSKNRQLWEKFSQSKAYQDLLKDIEASGQKKDN